MSRVASVQNLLESYFEACMTCLQLADWMSNHSLSVRATNGRMSLSNRTVVPDSRFSVSPSLSRRLIIWENPICTLPCWGAQSGECDAASYRERSYLNDTVLFRVAQALNLNHLGPDPYLQAGDNGAQRMTPKAIINREVKKRTWWQLVIQGKRHVHRLDRNLCSDTLATYRLVSRGLQPMQW